MTAYMFGGAPTLQPSGDPTGSTDYSNIQGLLNLSSPGAQISLGTGIFRTIAPIRMLAERVLQGTRGSTAGSDASSQAGTVIEPVASGWSPIYSGASGTTKLNGGIVFDDQTVGQSSVGAQLYDLTIDCRNATDPSLCGIVSYGNCSSVRVERCAVYKAQADGLYVFGSVDGAGNPDGWHIMGLLLQNCGQSGTGWGQNGTHEDSTYFDIHDQGCASGGCLVTSNNIRMIGCRADTSNGTHAPGFKITAGYTNTGTNYGYQSVQMIGCATEYNSGHGVYCSSNITGHRAPIIISGGVFQGDGQDGTGGNGMAAIYVEGGQLIVNIEGSICTTNTRTSPAYSYPDYGLATAAVGGSVPAVVNMISGILQGAVGPLNDAAPAASLFIGQGVSTAPGGVYNGQVTAGGASTPLPQLNLAGGTALNTNPTFEAGTAGWVAQNNATLTQDATHVHGGSWAGLVTPDGVTASPQIATSPNKAVTPGQTVTFSPWVFVSDGSAGMHSIKAAIHFYNSAGTHLSSSDISTTSATVTTAWQQITATGAVPAGAVKAAAFVTMTGTPAATVLLWVDDAPFTGPTPDLLTLQETADTYPRLVGNANGTLSFGSGSATPDTDLYRSAAGTLKTDGAFTVGGAFTSQAVSGSVTHADPATTTSTTEVMMGLGDTWQVTPGSSGKVLVIISGQATTLTNSTTMTAGARYGTGTHPANGVAVTGTTIGTDQVIRPAGTAGGVGFTLHAVLTLTPGTTYWFDIAAMTGTGADAAKVEDCLLTYLEAQ